MGQETSSFFQDSTTTIVSLENLDLRCISGILVVWGRGRGEGCNLLWLFIGSRVLIFLFSFFCGVVERVASF